jgi:hypothetical protein
MLESIRLATAQNDTKQRRNSQTLDTGALLLRTFATRNSACIETKPNLKLWSHYKITTEIKLPRLDQIIHSFANAFLEIARSSTNQPAKTALQLRFFGELCG